MPVASTMPASAVEVGETSMRMSAAGDADTIFFGQSRTCAILRRVAIDAPQTGGACFGMTLTKLDLTGLKCPLPALRTRKALKSIAPGDRLEVRCTDPLAAIDIPHLVQTTGDRVEGVERNASDIVFLIEKSPSSSASKPPP